MMKLTHKQHEAMRDIYGWNTFFEMLGEQPSAYTDGRIARALVNRGLITDTAQQMLTAQGREYCQRFFVFRKPSKKTVNPGDSTRLTLIVDMMRRTNVDYVAEPNLDMQEHHTRVKRTGELIDTVTNILLLRQN